MKKKFLKQSFLTFLIMSPLTILPGLSTAVETALTCASIAYFHYLENSEINAFKAQLPQAQELEEASAQEIDHFKNILQKQVDELITFQENLSPLRYPIAITTGILIFALTLFLIDLRKYPNIINISGTVASGYIILAPFFNDLIINKKLEILNNLLNFCQQYISLYMQKFQNLITSGNYKEAAELLKRRINELSLELKQQCSQMIYEKLVEQKFYLEEMQQLLKAEA